MERDGTIGTRSHQCKGKVLDQVKFKVKISARNVPARGAGLGLSRPESRPEQERAILTHTDFELELHEQSWLALIFTLNFTWATEEVNLTIDQCKEKVPDRDRTWNGPSENREDTALQPTLHMNARNQTKPY